MNQRETNIKKILAHYCKSELQDCIDDAFVGVHRIAQTKSGDISPDQHMQLENLQKQIVDLMVDQVYQNMDTEGEDYAGEFTLQFHSDYGRKNFLVENFPNAKEVEGSVGQMDDDGVQIFIDPVQYSITIFVF